MTATTAEPGPAPNPLATARTAATTARTAALAAAARAKGRAGALTLGALACWAGAAWTVGAGWGLTVTGAVLLAAEWARDGGAR